jgi:hypothetical protein
MKLKSKLMDYFCPRLNKQTKKGSYLAKPLQQNKFEPIVIQSTIMINV